MHSKVDTFTKIHRNLCVKIRCISKRIFRVILVKKLLELEKYIRNIAKLRPKTKYTWMMYPNVNTILWFCDTSSFMRPYMNFHFGFM